MPRHQPRSARDRDAGSRGACHASNGTGRREVVACSGARCPSIELPQTRPPHNGARRPVSDGGSSGPRPTRRKQRLGPRRGGDPTPLSALLAGSRATSRAASGAGIDQDSWRKVVGPRIAERTRPGAMRERVLTVYAASAVWVQELSLLADDIRGRLRRAGFVLDAIRFRVDETTRRTRAPRAPERVEPVSLPEDLAAKISGIDDEALRAAVARAASLSLGLPEPAIAKRPDVRGLRSAVPESGPSGPDDPVPRAASRRSRAGPGG